MTARLRVRDSRNAGYYYDYQHYNKSVCASSAFWASYGYAGGLYSSGSYESMDDIIGDKPQKSLGLRGFRFHPMSKKKQTISVGTGSFWHIETAGTSCTSPYTFKPAWRRQGSLMPGRNYSGFAFSIDSFGRLITPDIADKRAYSQALNLCITECLSKVGRGGSETNLYEALAEVDKTLKIASEYLQVASKIARSKGLVNKVKASGNAYLLTRYGFKPLVSDIFAILQALKTPLGSIIETSRASSAVVYSTSSVNSVNDGGTFYVDGLITRTQTVTIRATSLNQYVKSLADALGLGYKNLMTVPWELMPYSFVVDWFVNVGALLGSLTPNFGVTPIGSCYTEEIVTKDSYVQTGVRPIHTHVTLQAPSDASCEMQFTCKNRLVGLPSPTLEVKTDFRFDHLTRALDASALLLQRLR